MKFFIITCIFLASSFFKPVFAVEKDGAQIYQEVCSSCHATGVVNAPKLGDQIAWKKLISEGQVTLTAHGYVGVRAMPPKGGKQDLSVDQFAEALNYMVGKSGGNWTTPNKSMREKIIKEIAARQKNKS
jgi:mono/diheme cytochrome c family protein